MAEAWQRQEGDSDLTVGPDGVVCPEELDRTVVPDATPQTPDDRTVFEPGTSPAAAVENASDQTFALPGGGRPTPEANNDRTVVPNADLQPPDDKTVLDPSTSPALAVEKSSDQTIAAPGRVRPTPAPNNDRTGVWSDSQAEATPDGTMGFSVDAEAAEVRVSPQSKDVSRGNWPRISGYEILGELGRGAMGVVYKARQVGLKRVVALKMILAGGQASRMEVQRFRTEAEAVARLQHVNIAQVYEIGEYRGMPYFTLEFVEGGCLADQLAEKPPPVREAARIVEQLARAMGYAHARGIIHRDLKPANVLLTADRVPKVTDFGLAKNIEEDSGATRAGAIMGTPSYMAPEQADGRTNEIGPPADIYALGSILYDLLTGRPPFRGSTILETLTQVRNAEPVPPARLSPQMPRDLETICLKCLEKEPRKRYLTAIDLAADLERFLDGRPIQARPTPAWERAWKWSRRHPAAAALIAVSTVSLLALGIGGVATARLEARRATEAEILRGRAEEHFREAREAVDQMLTRVGQERLAHEPRMEKVRRDLLEKAMHFYERFLEADADDPAIRLEAARAARKVGDIRTLLGQYAEAEAAHDQAVAKLTALSDDYPGDTNYALELASAHNNRANLYRAIGRRADAAQGYLLAAELQEAQLAKQPDLPGLRQDLAISQFNRGVVLQALGQGTEAERAYSAALELQQQTAHDEPNNQAVRQELARTWTNLGDLRRAANPAEAEKALREALRLLEALVQESPTNPAFRQELALASYHLGTQLRDTRPRQAEKLLRRSIELGEALVVDFPTIPDHRQELAGSLGNLAVLLLSQGHEPEADRAMARSLELREKLVRDFPARPDYRRELAVPLVNRAIALQTSNRPAEARTAYDRAEELLSGLAQKQPDVPDHQQELARVLVNRAVLRQGADRAGAEKDLRAAMAWQEKLAAGGANNRDQRAERARTAVVLGTLLQINGENGEAEKVHGKARTAYRALEKDYPREKEYRQGLAGCLINLGDLYRATRRFKEAEQAWREAEKRFTELAATDENTPAYKREQAKALHNLGVLYNGLNRLAEAETAHKQALALRTALVQRYPNEAALSQELASTHAELAIAQARRNNLTASEASFRQALTILEGLEKRFPREPAYWNDQMTQNNNLAGLLDALGRGNDAAKCWRRVIALKRMRSDAFPTVADYRSDLARTLHDLAGKLAQRGKRPEARRWLEDAIRQQTTACTLAPTNPVYRQLLCMHHLGLADALLADNDHAGAAKEVGVVVGEAPADWNQYHVAASLLARAASLAAEDKGLDEAKRPAVAKGYGDRAVALLRKALEGGFRDAQALRDAKEFGALGSREDFKKVLAEMGKP